jgi:hypothetical protein
MNTSKSFYVFLSLVLMQLVFCWCISTNLSRSINTVSAETDSLHFWSSAPVLMKSNIYPKLVSSLPFRSEFQELTNSEVINHDVSDKPELRDTKIVNKVNATKDSLSKAKKIEIKNIVSSHFGPSTFETRVIDPVLMHINLYSKAASKLLLGTAIQESSLGKLSKNMFQIQTQTVQDLNMHYLVHHRELKNVVHKLYDPEHSISWNLNNNVEYEVAIARIIYLRGNQQLPHASNIDGLAHFWKKYYNTYLGKGTPNQFKSHFYDYVSEV